MGWGAQRQGGARRPTALRRSTVVSPRGGSKTRPPCRAAAGPSPTQWGQNGQTNVQRDLVNQLTTYIWAFLIMFCFQKNFKLSRTNAVGRRGGRDTAHSAGIGFRKEKLPAQIKAMSANTNWNVEFHSICFDGIASVMVLIFHLYVFD